MRWLDAVIARLRLLVSRRDAESRMNQEFRLHIDLETEKLMRETRLVPGEARRRAIAGFGGVEKHKEELRDSRGLAWLGGFALDLKLAARLLVKYPGLTFVGTAAMAFGIAAGVGAFEIRKQLVAPSLPLDEGSRIVGLRNWDEAGIRPVLPTAYEFIGWREELTLVEDLSAASVFHRNLLTDDGRSEAVAVAAMTESAFRMARMPALLGRTLVETDERPGSPPVIVMGHEIWRERFAGDPDVLGRTVRLGNEETTVVGVMPEGFAFPAAHAAWVPLRIDNVVSASREGPTLLVFGRLAKDASTERAQAELHAIGLRMAAGSPERRERLRPQIVPYTRLFFDPENVRIGVNLGNAFVVMLLVLVSANVALLMFARAASRESEIALRSALGAGRARIVTQLFVEALVLAGLAVGVGLAAARVGLRGFLALREAYSGQPLPFWVGDSLTPATIIYAAGLTLLSAAIIGVLPALKITGRGQQERLRQSTAGGGGFRFGGLWTAVIASQIAVTLMFPAAAFFFHRWVVDGQTRDVGFPAHQYLSTRLEFERERAPGVPLDATEQGFRSRVRRTYTELEQRLIAEREAAGVTFADPLPGTLHPRWRIDLDGEAAPGASVQGQDVRSASVALNFFDVLGAPVLSGRNFTAADLESSRGVVIVNQSFVNHVLGGQNPVGRRIRRRPFEGSPAPDPWLEIVGVVKDLGMLGGDGEGGAAGLYQPVSPERASTLWLAIRVTGSPESFAARLRTVASEVEPTLQIHELMPLDAVGASGWLESQYMSRVLAVLSAIALLLSLTAIYSVMAFTVAKRTREIGIRVALGADRRRVIAAILRRPLAQVSLGIVLGAVLVAATFALLYQSAPTATEAVMIAAYSMLMMCVCLLACVVPTLRALRVEPADVLRVDG
jgi:predicted permease